MRHIALMWISLVLALSIPALVLGQNNEDYEREQASIRRFNAAAQIEKRYGHFVQGRQIYVETSDSLSQRIARWQESAHEWVTNWLQVFALADLRQDIPYTQFTTKLEELFRDQETTFEELRQDVQKLVTAVESTYILFDSLTPIPDVHELAEYQSILDFYWDTETAARDALGQNAEILIDRIHELSQINAVSRRVILAHLEQALIANQMYPLQSTLDEVGSLLQTQEVIEPILAKLTHLEHELNRHSLYLRIFHAKDAIVAGRQYCAKAQKELNAIGGPAKFVNAARNRADQLCTAMENHFAMLDGLGYPTWDLVSESINVEKYELFDLCTNAVNPALACEKLAVLAALPQESFQSMTEEELKFVEYAWVQGLEDANKASGH